MRMISMKVGALAVAAVLWLPGLSVGQTAPEGWTVPRTVDGRPDLQGVWANNNATPLERPEEWAGKERLTDEELSALVAAASEATDAGADALFGDQLVLAAIKRQKAQSYDPTTGNYNQFWIADRTFNNRTSLVVDPPDGRVPALTESAQETQAGYVAHITEHPADSYTDRPLHERCVTYGAPNIGAGYNSYFHIIQNADHLVIVMEMIHDARVIPIVERAHIDESVRQLHGDSRARWDGDTLVIETKNFRPTAASFRPTSERLVVTERLTRVGPDTLRYEVTYDDPETWTRPWTVDIPLAHSTEPIFEYACHEGNIGMEGILAGHRAEEAAAAMSKSE